MHVQLVVEQGRKRKVFPIRSSSAVLGRSKGNSVRIPSAEVSRRHCRLIMEDGLVSVEDLDSVNGTFLNGSRIKQTEMVRPGDRLGVGPVTFVVEYELTPEALERLQGQVEPIDMLEALADGEVLEVDEFEPFEFDVEPIGPLPDLEEVVPIRPEKPSNKAKPKPPPIKASSDPEDNPPSIGFEFGADGWAAPDGGDLRDILAQIEDEETAVPPPPPKKKKK